MRHVLPLVVLLAACGDDAPEPVVVTDTGVAVVDAAPDRILVEDDAEDGVMDALADERAGDAVGAPAADLTPSADADVPAVAPPADPAPPAAAPTRDVLVEGTVADRAAGLEGDEETQDLAHGALADVFSEALYTVMGGGGSLLVERGADNTGGTYTLTRGGEEESGTWSLSGRTLRLGDAVYIITARDRFDLTFSGPDGDLRLQTTAG